MFKYFYFLVFIALVACGKTAQSDDTKVNSKETTVSCDEKNFKSLPFSGRSIDKERGFILSYDETQAEASVHLSVYDLQSHCKDSVQAIGYWGSQEIPVKAHPQKQEGEPYFVARSGDQLFVLKKSGCESALCSRTEMEPAIAFKWDLQGDDLKYGLYQGENAIFQGKLPLLKVKTSVPLHDFSKEKNL